MTKDCVRVAVPKSACYLRFADSDEEFVNEYKGSEDVGFTVRGEKVIIDYDVEGMIQGIELLGSDEAVKNCQSGG